MSIPIQSSPEPEQGAQTPLTQERRGNEFDQNTLSKSIGRGSEVQTNSQNSSRTFSAGQVNGVGATAPRDPANLSGLSVNGIDGAVARHVDERVLEGSGGPADYRKRGADAKLPDNPPVRSGMGQARLSNKLDTPPAASFTGNQTD